MKEEAAFRNKLLIDLYAQYYPHGLFWRNVSSLLYAKEKWMTKISELIPVRVGVDGQGDAGFILHGFGGEIETKVRYRPQSLAQIARQAAIERAGGTYIIARTLEDVTTVLDRLAQKAPASTDTPA